MSRLIDITGKRFGRLTVVGRGSNSNNGQARWLCKCDCGGTALVRGIHLRNGETVSCGCYAKEVSAKRHGEPHGHSDDRLYSVWQTMKRRCDNPNNGKYPAYGGRGITVCEEWRSSFSAFMEWALENGYDYNAPYGECTIDRIDVNGNYCPENCRWVDIKTQSENKRPHPKHSRGIEVEYKGVKYRSISELAEAYEIGADRLYGRVHRMPLEKAISESVNAKGKRKNERPTGR